MRLDELIARTGLQCFYHFTDLRNLSSIRAHGLLSYRELLRREIAVPGPGGNTWSHEQDAAKGLDQYVHLCFVAEHPMEYVARRDGHIGETRYLRILPDAVRVPGVMGCKCVANKSDAVIVPLEEALEEIDLDILFAARRRFTDPGFKKRFNEARKAEILVPTRIATHFITNLD